MRITPEELYGLRAAQLEAERKMLLAQLARNRAKAQLLELELKYGLLDKEGELDLRSGEIKEAAHESERDEGAAAPGPAR